MPRHRTAKTLFETIVPNWSAGDEFTTGDGRRFRILGIVGVPDDVGVYNAVWKVESVSRLTAR